MFRKPPPQPWQMESTTKLKAAPTLDFLAKQTPG